MKPSFDLCALSFLVQWIQSERQLHSRLRATPTGDAAYDALRYFQVSRNFEGVGDDVAVRERIRRLLQAVRATKLTTTNKVIVLASRFKKEFGRNNLSAASKLLWLSSRAPFVVYDERAVNALGMRWKDKANYSEYYRKWHREYSEHKASISASTARLARALPLVPKCGLSERELGALSNAEWFRQRVFDKYLWINGGD